MDHLGKYSLGRHDAFSHLLIDLAMRMAFLPDLRHLQDHVIALESRSYRKIPEIISFHHQILPKGSGFHPRSLLVKCIYLLR